MNLEKTRELTDKFTENEGRRPRLLLVALGTEEEHSLRLYAAAYADSGFDVDVGPLRQNPADAARMAAENDVHIIGLCGLQAGEEALFTQLTQELAAQGRDDIPCFLRAPQGWVESSQTLESFPATSSDYHAEAGTIIQTITKSYELA